MSFFDEVGSFFSSVGDGVGNFFESGINTFESGLNSIGDSFSGVYNDILGLGNKVVDIPTHIADKVFDTGGNVVAAITNDATQAIQSLGGNFQNVGQSFSWPLAIVGGIVASVYLLKK